MTPADVECIDPEGIRPVHEARDPRVLTPLLESMKRSGWLGRPLLAVVRDDGSLQALTGSHRLHAAKEARLATVPTLVVDGDDAALAQESRHFPLYPPGVAFHLFEHDRSWLGRYILLDDWTRQMDRPWIKKNINVIRELGHADMVPILAVKRWKCPE